jgi:predicted DNA-binding transcriptional regulator YafY
VSETGAERHLRSPPVNRTDRLYALVEELRAVSPSSRSAPALATRFEVSVRTIERDISALQQAGVPIYATPGRRGGYAIDKTMTLPPVNFTAAEAAAVALALARSGPTPFRSAARTALPKMLAAMSEVDAGAARRLASRVRLYQRADAEGPPPTPPLVEQAIVEQLVVAIDYRDRDGVRTERVVEPLAVMGIESAWYLSAWCRLRDGVRTFRLDRIRGARLTGEAAPEREIEARDGPPDLVPGPPLFE